MSNATATTPHSTAKKLPFKATALRKATSPNVETITDKKIWENDGLDLFRRSKEMEPIMAADHERRLKKKQRLEDERRKSAESSVKRFLDEDTGRNGMAMVKSGTPSQTARRDHAVARELVIDGEVLASDLATRPASKRTRLDSIDSKNTSLHIEDAEVELDNSPSAGLLRSHSKQTSSGSPHDDTLIPSHLPKVLLDPDKEESYQLTPAPTKQRGSVEPIEKSFIAGDENDEFAKYIREAEEQRALDQALLGVSPVAVAAKEKIEIMVTSIIPGTKPCCFKFLFDKQLRLARNTWLTLQKHKGILLDVKKEDEIVLTWRRKKVYAFSTLLSLGIRPQGNGRAVFHGHSTKGLTNSRTRVHIEAWTLDLFREMERKEELKRKRDTGELPNVESLAPIEEEPPAPEVKIRVILKARDIAGVKLTARPVTTVETLITCFRMQRSIGSDREVEIWFDGDRLEEHITMDEAEINDMDMFEVHVK